MSFNLQQFLTPESDPRRVEAEFDAIADDYDEEMSSKGYALPDGGAAEVARFVPVGERVLDAGCGTGLVGQRLHGLGYRDLVGVDISAKSLAVAAAKGVYRQTVKHNLLNLLPFAGGSFGGVACIAVTSRFGQYELVGVLREFARVVRPGGHIVFSYRENLNNGVRVAEGLARASLELIHVTEPGRAVMLFDDHGHVHVRYYVARRTPSDPDGLQ